MTSTSVYFGHPRHTSPERGYIALGCLVGFSAIDLSFDLYIPAAHSHHYMYTSSWPYANVIIQTFEYVAAALRLEGNRLSNLREAGLKFNYNVHPRLSQAQESSSRRSRKEEQQY